MKKNQLIRCICLATFISVISVYEIHAQSYNDGPIELRVRVRQVETNTPETDASLLGIGFSPDEQTYHFWARDNGNFDSQNWTGGQCLTQNFNPPAVSTDFITQIFGYTYLTATVPQFFDLRADNFEDDSDDALCPGSRCAFETNYCCGAVVFGVCAGITTSDDNHCVADPFKTNMDYRLGAPCGWYDHGFVTGTCGNDYKPRIESYWRYTKGTSCSNTIDLGTLTSGGSISHFNSNECYNNNFATSPGNDVFYQFTITSTTGVNISLCGAGTNFNTVLYLLDNACNQISSNNDFCGNISQITTNICTPGTYKVVVDGNTASSMGIFTLTIVDDPSNIMTVNLTKTDVKCNGGADGTATANVVGGSQPFTYLWSPGGATTATVTGLSIGNYSVTVNDGTGCSATATTTINQPTAISFSTSVIAPTCNGGNNGQIVVIALGGIPPYRYSKDGGNIFQNNSVLTNLTAGIYSVVVQDSNLCTQTNSVIITAPTAILPNLTITNISCNGQIDGSVVSNPTNGTPPYQYSLDASPFVVTNSFTGLSTGFHTFTVRDSNSCTGSAGFNIFEPAVLSSIVLTRVNVSCNGLSDGGFTVQGSGGTPPYTFSLNDTVYQSSGTFMGLAAGSYNVYSKDSNGCKALNIVDVFEPSPLILSLLLQFDISCTGNGDGAVAILASGGVSPYVYSVDGVFYRAQNFYDNLSAGTYTYYAKDNNGCADTITVTMQDPLALGLTSSSITNATCLGITNGSITLAGLGGSPPYEFAIDGGPYQNDSTFIGLDAGSYQFTVRDFQKCEYTQSFSIGFATSITASIISQTNVLCNGDSSGSITADASSGVPPYTYSIDGTTFQSGGIFSGLSGGNYTVTIKDNSGCLAVLNVTLTEPAAMQAVLVSITDAKCFNTNDGAADVDIIGGTVPYSYSWSNGFATQDLVGVGGGTYILNATDVNGCTATISITIGQSIEMFLDIESIVNVSCNGDSDGSINVTVSGGIPPYIYVWNRGDNTEDLIGISANTYILTVTDANQCSLTENYTITQPPVLNVAVNSTIDISCYNGGDGLVSGSASGGEPPYTYSVNGITYQADTLFTGLFAGNYVMVARDANGCETADNFSLVAGTEIFFSYGSEIEIINGQSYQLTPILIPSNLVADTVIWNPITALSCIGCINPIANPTETTVYTATLIDENGCQASTTIRIIVKEEFKVFIPNIFSPNSDGANDRFSLWAYGTDKIEVRLFNRWGAEVYFNSNQQPNTDTDGWDGKFNGEESQQGTYLYLLDVSFRNEEQKQFTGSVTLIR